MKSFIEKAIEILHWFEEEWWWILYSKPFNETPYFALRALAGFDKLYDISHNTMSKISKMNRKNKPTLQWEEI